MSKRDDVEKKVTRTILPLLAGLGLFALAATMTGPLALITAVFGGIAVGGALATPFVNRDECDCDPPDMVRPPVHRHRPQPGQHHRRRSDNRPHGNGQPRADRPGI